MFVFSKDHGDDDMDMETLEHVRWNDAGRGRWLRLFLRIGDQQRFEAMVSDGIRGMGMEIPGDVD